MASQNECVAPLDYALQTMTARELLATVDRSQPQVSALATHLEKLLDGLDTLKARLGAHASTACDLEDHVSRLQWTQAQFPFLVLPDD